MAVVNLDGTFGNFTLNHETGEGTPLLVHAYFPEDAALRYMWSEDNRNSTIKFLRDMPRGTHMLFISYGCELLTLR